MKSTIKTNKKVHFLLGLFLFSAISLCLSSNSDQSNNFSNSTSRENYEEKSTILKSSEVNLPENMYNYISNFTCTQGYNESGNLNSLKYKDGNGLKLAAEGTPGNYYLNITFNFTCDLSFTTYTRDYWDLYLFLDIVNITYSLGDTLVLKRLVPTENSADLKWITVKDENDQAILITGTPIDIDLLYLERTFAFRIINLVPDPFNNQKSLSIDRMSVVLTHKKSLPLSTSVYPVYARHSYSDISITYFGSTMYGYSFYNYTGNWIENWDIKELIGHVDTQGTGIDHGVTMTVNVNLTFNVDTIPTAYYDADSILTIGFEGSYYGALWPDATVGLRLWDYSNAGTYSPWRDTVLTTSKAPYSISWDEDDLDLTDDFLRFSNNYNRTRLRFQCSLSAHAQPWNSGGSDDWIDYCSLQLLVNNYYGLNSVDYPEITSNSLNIDDFGMFSVRATVFPKFGSDIIPDELTICRLLNSSGIVLDTKEMSGPDTGGLYQSDLFNSMDYREGDYLLLFYTEDSSGYGTYNITKIIINNEDPSVVWDQPISEGDPYYLDQSDFAAVVDINDADNPPTVIPNYYEHNVYVALFQSGTNKTDWCKMQNQTNGGDWTKEWTKTDLTSLNVYNGECEVRVRVQDGRGYYYFERTAILFDLLNPPTTPLGSVSGDGGGGGGSGSGSAKADNTVVMVAVIGCLGAGGAVAGIVVLKVRKGATYRKDVKTIPKKFGKVGSFKTAGSSGVSKLSVSSGTTSSQTQASSNVFQINKKE